MHLATVLELASHRYPEVWAIVERIRKHTRRFSYGTWNRRVNAVARGLVQAGVQPGDRVGLCAANGEATATTYFAVHKAGAVAVFLNTRWKAPELAHALDDSDVRALLYDRTTAAEVEQALNLSGRSVVRVTAGMKASSRERNTLRYEDLAAEPTVQAPNLPRRDTEVGTILYTSGTTGRPKGVPRSHRNDYYAALAMILEHRWTRFERTLAVMPLYHTMGLHTLISMVILNGASILLPGFDPAECLGCIAAERVTALYLVPTAYHDLVEQARRSGQPAPQVGKLATAGAPMPVSLVEKCRAAFSPKVFVNHYGCTEMHIISVNPNLTRKPESVGRPALHSRVRVVKADPNRQVPPTEVLPRGTTGEIIVEAASPQAFSGYLNQPEATEQALRDGWYFTGDLGFMDSEGDLHLVGRVDEMINTGGENVYPAEVEEVLRHHPGVRDVAVVGMPDERWGEIVTAFVVPASGAPSPETLEQFCIESPALARYKRPRRYIFVQAIPRSPAGKVLRSLLKEGRYTLFRDNQEGRLAGR